MSEAIGIESVRNRRASMRAYATVLWAAALIVPIPGVAQPAEDRTAVAAYVAKANEMLDACLAATSSQIRPPCTADADADAQIKPYFEAAAGVVRFERGTKGYLRAYREQWSDLLHQLAHSHRNSGGVADAKLQTELETLRRLEARVR